MRLYELIVLLYKDSWKKTSGSRKSDILRDEFISDTVLDPFMGSGSTVVAAKQNNREGIGIDIEREYCEIAMHHILKETK